MSPGLFDALHGLVSTGVARTASATLDEHESGASRAMDAAFAAVLCGLERNAGDPAVMGEVAKLIGDRGIDTAILHDVSGLIETGRKSGAIASGEKLLDLLFGARTGTISAAVARASGIGGQSAARLLPAAGALVLALLGRRLGAGVPPANTVSGAIAGERNTLLRIVPPYLRNLIGPVRDGGTKVVAGPAPAKAPAPAPAAAGTLSLMWMLLPLVLIGGLAWYLLSYDTSTYETRRTGSEPATRTAEADRDRETGRETKTAAREEPKPARPSITTEWTFDPTPLRPADPGTATTSSSTWTAPTTPPAGSAASRKAPPLPGLERITLADGNEIDYVPGTGVERKVVDFIGDRWSAIEKTRWFDFDRIRFRSGSSELTPGSRVQLRNTAAIMKAYPKVAIKIGGYTDNVGDPGANLRLSDDRAKRVMAELVKLGVAPERLEAEGYGNLHPIAENTSAEGRAKNRRTAVSVRAK